MGCKRRGGLFDSLFSCEIVFKAPGLGGVFGRLFDRVAFQGTNQGGKAFRLLHARLARVFHARSGKLFDWLFGWGEFCHAKAGRLVGWFFGSESLLHARAGRLFRLFFG